jgi:putative ABC transport system permease protein
VLGTTNDYFKHYSYNTGKPLSFTQGEVFNRVFDVVLGYDVAKALGYQLNNNIVVAHGLAETSFKQHDENPFTVVGILARTGTPVDQTVHVSLQGIEAIHQPGKHKNLLLTESETYPQSVTAMMLGLKSKMATFRVQRYINNYTKEPLTSILPGVALLELWQMMSLLENVLRLISAFVLVASLLGLSAMLLTSIRERNQEIHLLRIIGASPLYLFFLIELEAILICLFSIAIGTSGLCLVALLADDLLASLFGLSISVSIFTVESLMLLLAILVLTAVTSMVPAISGYRQANVH